MTRPAPRLFTPLTIRGVTIRNRVAVSPMAMYMAENGYAQPFHFVHYGKFAMGGAGIVFVEEAAIARNGRISNGCLGLWEDGQVEALAPIVAFMKSQGATTALQINHGGRKSSTQRAWEGNSLLTEENLANGDEKWQPVGASATPFSEGWPAPTPLDEAGLQGIRDGFVASAKRALAAGFDIIELHMAHGYLLQSFLSPIANKRTDVYGGSLENRMRLPLEVAEAVRAAIPDAVPLFARISAIDWIEGGWELEDSVVLARELSKRGVDLVDCSSGGNLPKGATNSNLTRGPGYQAPFAKRLREEADVMTQAVGFIRTPELAEQLLQDGFADMIAVGRQMLFDPFWAVHAAEALGVTENFANPAVAWPKPYAWWLEKWANGLTAAGDAPNPAGPPRD